MSLSNDKIEKLVRVAVIEGNLVAARLIRLLQPCKPPNSNAVAYTDGKAIYVGDLFWKRPLNEQYFIINHEFLHIILKHVERAKMKNMRIYNIAADVIINDMLHKRGRRVPKDAVTYDTFSVPLELDTTEKVYDFLLENISNDEMPDMEDLLLEPDESLPGQLLQEIKDLAEKETSNNYSAQAVKEEIKAVPQDFFERVSWFDDLEAEIGRLAVRTNIKTYNRPPRLKVEGCLMRGEYIEQSVPKINVIIDVSCSMGDEPLKIAGKIHQMQNYLKIFKPDYYWLNHEWGIIDDLTNIPLGGGTDLAKVEEIKSADMNVLITDCKDNNGVNVINNSTNRFYIVTNNKCHAFRESHNNRVFLTDNF